MRMDELSTRFTVDDLKGGSLESFLSFWQKVFFPLEGKISVPRRESFLGSMRTFGSSESRDESWWR